MTISIRSRIRLTLDAQSRQPELESAIGTVLDLGGGAAKVRWPRMESWHRESDLEPAETA
jgi:hypothetical protein